MRPTPGRMFFLYMRDCENEICVTAQEWKLEKKNPQPSNE